VTVESERHERIDDAVERWHELDPVVWALLGRPELHQWLGWSWEEYKRFVERGELPEHRSLSL
jgi:hypothetical protein